jgi:hypothetical protein
MTTETPPTIVTEDAVAFFKLHQGLARYPFETEEQAAHRCAVENAEAEAWLGREIEAGRATIEWHDDPDYIGAGGDIPDDEWADAVEQYGHPGCVIKRKQTCGHWDVAASLWSIVGDENYHRVVMAELASEARA